MFKLLREETSVEDAVNNRHQWPVKYTALYAEDDSPAPIFVMQLSPDTGLFSDSLSCIASAIQMHDLPVGEAAPGSPFYRVHVVTKLCRSAKAAAEFIAKVEEAVQDLADNLQSASLLSAAGETVITPTES